MDNQNLLQDISHIKQMMNRSSKFLSLSGLSGIMAGIYALIGAVVANSVINDKVVYAQPFTRDQVQLLLNLMLIAFVVLVLSLVTAYLLSLKKARKSGEKLWDITAKNLLKAFLVPLITGGIFGLILINQQHYGILSSVTLVFYGLALINASKYTYGTIYYLGISEIFIGLFAAALPGYGLWFWAVGFGFFHILYGSIMYVKFDKK